MRWERLGAAVVVGDLTLTPVERISLVCHRRGRAFLVAGSKRPVAVILHRGDREWRLVIPDDESSAAVEG